MSEEKQRKKRAPGVYPVLPLRDIVVFRHDRAAFVGREKSIHALEEVMKADKQILLAAQKKPATTIRRRTPSTTSAPSPPCCSC